MIYTRQFAHCRADRLQMRRDRFRLAPGGCRARNRATSGGRQNLPACLVRLLVAEVVACSGESYAEMGKVWHGLRPWAGEACRPAPSHDTLGPLDSIAHAQAKGDAGLQYCRQIDLTRPWACGSQWPSRRRKGKVAKAMVHSTALSQTRLFACVHAPSHRRLTALPRWRDWPIGGALCSEIEQGRRRT